MQPQKKDRPFTFKLAYLLLAVIFLYLVSNIAFILHCSARFYLSNEDGICQIAHSFRPLAAGIPVVARPVNFLNLGGQMQRANVVEYDYLFSWGSAIAAWLIMLLITGVMILASDANDRRQLRNRLEEARRQFGDALDTSLRNVVALLLMAALFALFDAYWGYFDFSGQLSLANWVHVRDVDLYRISVDLSLFSMFGVFFLVWAARILALKKPTWWRER